MAETKEKKSPKSKYSSLIDKIGKLTVVELNQFIKDLQDHFQISLNLSAESETGGETNDKTSKKDEVNVILTEIGKSKIAVIKVVAKITGKGLLEAKKMLDTLPLTLASQISQVEGEKIKTEVETAGATVELK